MPGPALDTALRRLYGDCVAGPLHFGSRGYAPVLCNAFAQQYVRELVLQHVAATPACRANALGSPIQVAMASIVGVPAYMLPWEPVHELLPTRT